MITFLFIVLMFAVFGMLLGFAIRFTWGMFKVLLTLIFLPAIIIFAFIKGLFILAFPLLAVIGLISLVSPSSRRIQQH